MSQHASQIYGLPVQAFQVNFSYLWFHNSVKTGELHFLPLQVFAKTIEYCQPYVNTYVEDDFRSQSNRNFDVTVKPFGEQTHEYEEEVQLYIYSVELYEESGSNLFLVATNSHCKILHKFETWNSDHD